jgi:hypothetical protein
MQGYNPNQEPRSGATGVESWFFAWIGRHMTRCPSQGWPEFIAGAPDKNAEHFFAAWIKTFRERGVTEPVADEASMLLSQGKYSWPSGKHLEELLAHVQTAWDRVHAQQKGIAPGTREEAALMSKGCPECNGDGFAARDMKKYEQLYSTAFFCLCPMGEWLAQYYFGLKDKEIYSRVRRLSQYPELWNTGFTHRSWPREPVPRPWPLESFWCAPWIYEIPGAGGYDRGMTAAAVKGVGEGIGGEPF